MSFPTDKEVVELYPCNKSIYMLHVENKEEKMVFHTSSSSQVKKNVAKVSGAATG